MVDSPSGYTPQRAGELSYSQSTPSPRAPGGPAMPFQFEGMCRSTGHHLFSHIDTLPTQAASPPPSRTSKEGTTLLDSTGKRSRPAPRKGHSLRRQVIPPQGGKPVSVKMSNSPYPFLPPSETLFPARQFARETARACSGRTSNTPQGCTYATSRSVRAVSPSLRTTE